MHDCGRANRENESSEANSFLGLILLSDEMDGNELIYTIDGENFRDLEGFYDEVGRILIPGQHWGRNLDAFNDILFWPFASKPYVLVWKNSNISRQRLGYIKMIEILERMSRNCHPVNVPGVRERLESAKMAEGPTLFDFLVEIIQYNAECVSLRLE